MKITFSFVMKCHHAHYREKMTYFTVIMSKGVVKLQMLHGSLPILENFKCACHLIRKNTILLLIMYISNFSMNTYYYSEIGPSKFSSSSLTLIYPF